MASSNNFDKNSLDNARKMAAVRYVEKYGIVSYRLEGWVLIYNVSYPAYLNNLRYTIQHRVNLQTGESTSRQLKRYDANGEVNRG